MLQIFHKYRRTFGGLLIVSLAVLLLSGFGLEYYFRDQRQQVYAIRVGEETISHFEFEQARQQELEQYRRIFGDQVYRMLDQFKININQQLADRLVNELLVSQAARGADLHVSDEEVQAFLIQQLPNRITKDDYLRFLRQIGETPESYERKVADDLLRQQYSQIFAAASIPSRREIESSILRSDTKITAEVVAFDPKSFSGKVPDASEAELKELYERIQSELELPEQVSYSYVVVTPQMVKGEIPVSADDVEVAYFDRTREFTTPEEGELSHILVAIPSGATDVQKNEARTKAELAASKIAAGESFESLALQFSDDLSSKAKGGDLGAVRRGMLPQVVLDTAFKLSPGSVSPVIESPRGFHIVKVRSYTPERVKPLEEVRASIEEDIRNTEAPAFAADKAHALFERWLKSKKPLADFAAEQKLTVASTNGTLTASVDPEPLVPGLTKQVLRDVDDKAQVIELGEQMVLVEVLQYKEPEVPSFESSRERLVERYKSQKVVELARTAADDFLAIAREKNDLKAAAVAQKVKTTVVKDVSMSGASEAPFSDAEVRQEALMGSKGSFASKPVTIDGIQYVYQITAVTTPTVEEIQLKIDEQRAQAAQELEQLLFASTLRRLKKMSESIDVDAGVLTRE